MKASLSEADLRKVAERTQGFSGSDMRGLLSEVSNMPIRDAQNVGHSRGSGWLYIAVQLQR